MTVGQKLSWKEIQEAYPDQWVSLCDLEFDEHDGDVASGVVIAAGPDLKIVAQQSRGKEFSDIHSFQYTGQIKHFLGLAEWNIEDAPPAHS